MSTGTTSSASHPRRSRATSRRTFHRVRSSYRKGRSPTPPTAISRGIVYSIPVSGEHDVEADLDYLSGGVPGGAVDPRRRRDRLAACSTEDRTPPDHGVVEVTGFSGSSTMTRVERAGDLRRSGRPGTVGRRRAERRCRSAGAASAWRTRFSLRSPSARARDRRRRLRPKVGSARPRSRSPNTVARCPRSTT